MDWILIAVVSGSLLVSGHQTKEACMGRIATLAEQKINAKCVESSAALSGALYGGSGGSGCVNCAYVK